MIDPTNLNELYNAMVTAASLLTQGTLTQAGAEAYKKLIQVFTQKAKKSKNLSNEEIDSLNEISTIPPENLKSIINKIQPHLDLDVIEAFTYLKQSLPSIHVQIDTQNVFKGDVKAVINGDKHIINIS